MRTPKVSANKSKFILGIGTLASIIIVGGILYQAQQEYLLEPEILLIPEQILENQVQIPQVPEATIPTTKPAKEAESVIDEKTNKSSLPELDKSDQFIRERVSMLTTKEGLGAWLTPDDLLRRSASYLDGLARGIILSNIFPLSLPEDRFTTHQDGPKIWLNAGNYERYNATISVIASMDMELAAKIFHFARPLLESAFSELGYRPRQMDGIILTALDQIIDTPIIVEPIQLTRESVVYKFADPKLESLSSLQKQLLRTGPENSKRLAQQALLLKTALMAPNGES
jgi:hypothetical protein